MDQFSERLTFWLFLWKWELPGLQQKVDIYSLQHLEKAKREKKDSSFSFYLLWCSKQWIVELMLREFSIISPVMSQWTSMSTRVRQENFFSASSVCNTGMDGERAWWVHCCQAKELELTTQDPLGRWRETTSITYHGNSRQSCCTCMTTHICANTHRTHTNKCNNLLLIQKRKTK